MGRQRWRPPQPLARSASDLCGGVRRSWLQRGGERRGRRTSDHLCAQMRVAANACHLRVLLTGARQPECDGPVRFCGVHACGGHVAGARSMGGHVCVCYGPTGRGTRTGH
eukprot:739333-Prymnesium_polylepis.1